jgi:GNAT superfamily N-acetyltransferase
MTSSTPVIASAAVAASPSLPRSVLSLLRHFQHAQSTRMSAYATFRNSFRQFMAEREVWEEEQAKVAERRAKESTLMLKGGMTAPAAADSSSAPATLASIREAQELAERSQPQPPSPERVFQRVCVDVMAQFQAVSKEVRGIIDALLAVALGGVNPASVDPAAVAAAAPLASPAAAEARHWSVLLQNLQQLEKLKLELTIHQQMLHNQRYVLAHPQAHGQVHEHSHHIHSVTDAHGRVRQHPRHPHSHPHSDLAHISEDQELEDNAQPFTRHLSALLSDTAHATQSPFLFPPSGAAPSSSKPEDSSAVPSAGATLKPERSEEAEETFRAEVNDLREQEGSVVQKINDILAEVREAVMEEAEDEEEMEAETKSGAQVSRQAAASSHGARVQVRPPHFADADAIGSVHARAWSAYAGILSNTGTGPFSIEWRQKQWRERLQAMESGTALPSDESPRSICILVSLHPSDSRIFGLVTAGLVRDHPALPALPAGCCELTSLNVEPEAWGSGAAQALMAAALNCMRQKGYANAVLWTMEKNARAIRFYEKEGWALDGVQREDEAEGQPFTAVRMQRVL